MEPLRRAPHGPRLIDGWRTALEGEGRQLRGSRTGTFEALLPLGVAAFASTGVACGGGDAPDASVGGEATADTVVVQSGLFVELFAPGAISTEAPEFATAFTPDGGTIFFNRASPDRAQLRILVATRENGSWTTPRVAPFSGTHRDVDPFVTPDGRRLLFSSDRPAVPGDTAGDFDLWVAERGPEAWGEPRRLGAEVNSEASEIFASASRDGRLVFGSTRDGPMRAYEARERDGSWEAPRPLRFGRETRGGNPAISPDGSALVFVLEREGSAAELFAACRRGEEWSAPRRLPRPVNSEFADFAPAFGPAGEWLYFTSERPGIAGPRPADVRAPGDLYRVRLADLDLCP